VGRRIAQLPVHLFQNQHQTGKPPKKIELFSHPFLNLFSSTNGRKPHEEYSVWELDYWTSVSLDLAGEAWWLTERDKYGAPSRVTPLPAHRMSLVFDRDTGFVKGYMFVPKGQTVQTGGIFIPKFSFKELQQPENLTKPFVTFFRYPSPLGIEDPRGWSPIKAAAYAYDINLFEQIYKSNFLQNGAQLGGILQSDVALSKEQIDEYLDQFESRHKGVRKAGIPMVLPKMLKWETTEPTPRDLQWVEVIGATESMLLQIYGISDAKLGRADIGNRSTAEAMDVTFNREVIQSRIDIKVSKLNTDFLPIYPKQTDQLYFSAEFDNPVPADGEMALKQEDQDLKNNVITRNEVRERRKMEPWKSPFGNAVYAQENNNFFDVTSTELKDLRVPGALDEHAAQVAKDSAKAKADALGQGGNDPNEPAPGGKKKKKPATEAKGADDAGRSL
jgi:HK97 family phage portal protein